MTQLQTEFECDRCGGSAGNGSVLECLVVSRLDEAGTGVENLHFCRENKCDTKVLSKANLAHYLEQRAAEEPAPEEPPKKKGK